MDDEQYKDITSGHSIEASSAVSLLRQNNQGDKKQEKPAITELRYGIFKEEPSKAIVTLPHAVEQSSLDIMDPSTSSEHLDRGQIPEIVEEDNFAPETGAHADSNDWAFDAIVPNRSNLRGGGCVSSLLCDKSDIEEHHRKLNREMQTCDERSRQASAQGGDIVQAERLEDKERQNISWKGWAEIENDPDIFTILLQDWGVPNTQVNEILDITDLLVANPTEILGLIFLSRYEPPNHDPIATPGSAATSEKVSSPWFANQISKFSCGTVALMNILMNSDLDLSETLSDFKSSTSTMNAKSRGIALDTNAQFRDIHNSFSTYLDRMIVDMLLKDDAAKHKQSKQAEAREARKVANADGAVGASKKRKRTGARFTKRRNTKKKDTTDDEESGFHFVAYVSAHNSVWKLDGMQARPRSVGTVGPDQTWLTIAVADLLQQVEDALKSGEECSLMGVTKVPDSSARQKIEKERKQEDWAPFIEHMLRLHLEKGDLQEMLRL